MAKIDTSRWKEFTLNELGFVNYHGERLNKALRIDGNIPFVTAGFDNRGIAQYIGNERRTYHRAITVDMFGNCFFQPNDCAGDDNIYFFVNDSITDASKLFISTCIHAKTSKEYAYVEQFRQTDADALSVTLPVTEFGEPDWVYMDSFMAEVMKESEACLENLRQTDGEKHALDVSEWREFIIGKLFAVVKGTRLTKAHMTPGNTRFIGSSAMNNGCTAMVGNTENMHPANTITVCYNGSVGETFYQDQPFLASDDVNVLYPKFDMTKEIALFVAPLIKSVSARYNYIDKWKQEDMIADAIKLPVDASGKPDWAYMDEYMRTVMEHTKSDLLAIQSIG